MYEKQNRIIRALKYFMGGGGGGSGTDIAPAQPSELKPWLNAETAGLNKFGKNQPLLNTAETGALGFWDQMFGAGSGQAFTSLYKNFLAPTIAGGGYSAEMGRIGSQVARTQAEATGTTKDNSALINEYQQRESVRNQNLNTALGQVGTMQGVQSNALNQLTGVESAKVGNFSQLLGPAANMILGNLQGRIAGAQIANQANMATEAQNKGLINSGISSIGSIAGAAAMSDERLKKKIKDTGKKRDGVPLKTFEYKTRPGVPFIGVMAQDLEKRFPWEVLTDPSSKIKMVSARFAPTQLQEEE